MNGLGKLHAELHNPDNRNKVIVLAGLVLVLFVVLLLNIDWRNAVPDLRNYRLRMREYENLRAQLAEEQADLIAAQMKSVRRNDVWSFNSAEDPRLAVLQKLETISAECSVNLRTTGNLKDVQLADGVIGYEVDVNADPAKLGDVCRFVIALSLSQPKFFWDSLTLKPSGGKVVLGGKLKVIVATSRAALAGYWGDKDA
ncbi:MAG: hypothetical protein PHI85_01270 [Victivallaceae bacterium]|nr:hypothetical protein [Victivallaceae bacterium]